MFIVGILSWWYGDGWIQRLVMFRERLAAMMDYFSIGLLVRTLFSPFRQISAGQVDGPLEIKLRALADRLISRCIGAMVRTAVMIVGIVAIMLYVLMSGVTMLVWAIAPVLPITGIILAITGVIPWKI